jgi:hypothetical protein
MDLSQLLEARDGRPTEHEAARKIATFAVIPAAMVGLLGGTQLVGLADPFIRLLWVCTATSSVAGFGVAFLVLGIYHLFGFRTVVMLADALVGGLVCLPFAALLTMLLMVFKVFHHNHALWALLLIPLGAIAVPLYRAWSKKSQVPAILGEAPGPQTDEPSDEQPPMR